MSKRNRKRDSDDNGWSTNLTSRGCLQIIIGAVVCGGAFLNLIIQQESETEFFAKAKPIKMGMSEQEVVAILGTPAKSENVEHTWGRKARDTARNGGIRVEVPERFQGVGMTQKLTWKHGQFSKLYVYQVDDSVVSTDTYRRSAKE